MSIFFSAVPRDSKTPEMDVLDRDLDNKKNPNEKYFFSDCHSVFIDGILSINLAGLIALYKPNNNPILKSGIIYL